MIVTVISIAVALISTYLILTRIMKVTSIIIEGPDLGYFLKEVQNMDERWKSRDRWFFIPIWDSPFKILGENDMKIIRDFHGGNGMEMEIKNLGELEKKNPQKLKILLREHIEVLSENTDVEDRGNGWKSDVATVKSLNRNYNFVYDLSRKRGQGICYYHRRTTRRSVNPLI